MAEQICRAGERADRINEDLTLIRKVGGLTFGTDAYLLAAYMRRQSRARAVEFGTGTGVIPLLCASAGRFAHIDALELQPEFAELAVRNVALNRLEDRISVHCADVREITAETLGGEADVVFSNPPYMRTDSGKRNEWDGKYLARHEAAGGIADFCEAARRLLKHGGKFYCVWRPDRLSELMSALAASGLEPKEMTFVHADAQTPPSMFLLMAKKGGAHGLKITPPLLLHPTGGDTAGARPLTETAQKIYDTMSFDTPDEFRRVRS